MNVNSISLTSEVDVNSLNSIHTDNNIKFAKKNSLVYEDLLSNYRKIEGDGQYTTLGNNIKTTNVTNNTIEFNNGEFASSANYVVKNSMFLTMPLSGIIKNEATLFVYNDRPYYQVIIEQNDILYHCLYDIETKEWTNTKLNVTEAFCLDTNYYVIALSNTTYSIINSVSKTTLKTITVTSAPSKANNGRFYKDTFYIGRNDDNQRLAWHTAFTLDSTTITANLYFGSIEKIQDKVVVTGEPYYKGATSSVLPNGIIRWQVNTMTCQSCVSCFNSLLTCELPKTYEDINACSGDTVGLCLRPTFEQYCSACLISRISYTGTTASYSYTQANNTTVVVNDPNMSPGNFWGTATCYESCFPFNYMYSNVATARGSTFDYGKGWNTSFSQKVSPTVCSECSKLNYPVLGYCPLQYIVNTACYNLDNTVNNNSNCNTVPLSALTNEIVYASTDTTYNDKRYRLVDYNVKENKAWDDFYHSIGGKNSGDETVIDNIPFTFNDGKFDRFIYNGIFSGVSLNGVLLNSTSSDGIEQFSYVENDNYLYILINNQLSVLKKNYTVEDVEIKKLADYVFTTNLVGYYNTFIETKDKQINFVNAYIPYHQTFSVNNVFQSQGYFSPTSSTNDIWYEAAAYNPNVKDEDRITSYILPPIEIPIYVDSNNLDDFNKKIIDNNQPVLSLTRNYVNDKTKLDVYYTHSLSSTDLTYKYSNRNSVSFFDKDLKDNTWITTGDLYIYPVGLLTVINGENNITPTVDLDDNYSVRLYSNNNTVYMSFNPTQAVYQSNEIFTIYTSSYYFDGQAIYYIGGTNDNTSNSFVCYALGMKFLGNSGTEAYFYSQFDKAIYLFSGSNTLTLYKNIAQLDEIIDTCFSSADQSLYILDSTGKLLVIKGDTSALFEIKDPDHLELTANGAVAYSKDGSYILYSPYKGNLEKFEIETEWIGSPDNLFNFAFVEVWLYKKDTPIKLKAVLSTQTDNDTTDDTREITIKPSDFSGLNYRLRFTPKNSKGNAFKFYLSSDDDISISSMSLAVDNASVVQAPRR